MKIGFVGKGGSGKSAMTWLFAEYFAEAGLNVYLIDADHNMDTAATFGVDINDTTPTFHRHHSHLKALLKLSDSDPWRSLLEDSTYPNPITLQNSDFSNLWQTTNKSGINLAAVGLGATDIINSGKCAHGHSAPLKWLLPALVTQSDEVILVDGVAGVNMMNYGLFSGLDCLVIVAEHHQNSERVAEQIIELAKKTKLPFICLGNRSQPQLSHTTLLTIDGDEAINNFDYSKISPDNKNKLSQVAKNFKQRDLKEIMESLLATTN